MRLWLESDDKLGDAPRQWGHDNSRADVVQNPVELLKIVAKTMGESVIELFQCARTPVGVICSLAGEVI